MLLFKINYFLITAEPHSQLSVIIVPVSCSLVAVFLIVFGVAYYIQNRNRFLVEVADFNFGEDQSLDGMEYKSFHKRLLDSISDYFIRHPDEIDDNNVAGGPSSVNNQDSSIRYGSMT